jgi:hypothetical protein
MQAQKGYAEEDREEEAKQKEKNQRKTSTDMQRRQIER